MTWKMMKLVLATKLPGITSSQKFVLVSLAGFSSTADGGGIYPSVARLAATVNLSVSQTQRILRKLEKLEYVIVEGGKKGGSYYATTRRRLNVPLLTRLHEVFGGYKGQLAPDLKGFVDFDGLMMAEMSKPH